MSTQWPVLRTALLLLVSNCFMTTAWYGHLKYRSSLSLVAAISISWCIALPEYAFQVPANRLGYGALSAYQLKILQECIALLVFVAFAWLVFREPPTWKQMASFALIFGAVALAFWK